MCGVCDYDYYDDEFISALLLYGPSAGRDYGDLRKIKNKFPNDECVAPYTCADGDDDDDDDQTHQRRPSIEADALFKIFHDHQMKLNPPPPTRNSMYKTSWIIRHFLNAFNLNRGGRECAQHVSRKTRFDNLIIIDPIISAFPLFFS